MSYLSINTNFNRYFYNEIVNLYELFCKENFEKEITIPSGFTPLIETIYNKHEQSIDKIKEYEIEPIFINKNTKDILVGFSGGLDSAYLSLKLKDEGYNVILFHLKGLNKNYPKEDVFSKNFALSNNFEYVEIPIKYNKKQFFIDNPLKNQMILSLMIDYGVKNNITNFGIGADLCTSIKDSKIGMTVTDSKEVNILFWQGVNKYFPNATPIFIENEVTKYNRLKYICKNHSEALNNIYSCITPNRFNQHLHETNNDKYNIELLEGRCGSCFKCCMEYLLLVEIGYYNQNDKMIEHCWKILSDSKNSHRKDLFDKKLPIEIRKQNLFNYGS